MVEQNVSTFSGNIGPEEEDGCGWEGYAKHEDALMLDRMKLLLETR
jgi:hypothetical protein